MSIVTPLCAECQKERKLFSERGDKQSPACAALWRLAFAKDENAWGCVQAIFEPWVKERCRVALNHAPQISGLSGEDLPDVIQDVWHNLWRYVVNHPTGALDVVQDDDLSRLIGLIKTTVKNRVLELCRKPRGYEDDLSEDDGQGDDDGPSGKRKPPQPDSPVSELWLDTVALLKKHIQTAKEYSIAELIFLQGMKPQDVLDLHPKQFTDIDEVNQTKQTLLRRIRGDTARQKSADSASLHFRLDPDAEVPMDLFEACPFDEGVLLDYVNGHVGVEIRTAIERSPACVQAAAALQADIEVWRPYLRQMVCPAGERLVAYQERRLTGTDYLVVDQHVQRCPYCHAEIQMLAAVDAVSTEPQPSLVRRLYEFIFQPATMSPVPVLGEGSYHTIERTPQIELLVRTTRTGGRTGGKQRNWMLFGRLRYEGDQQVTQVEAIIMQDIEDEDAPEFSTTVDEHGAFTIKGLDAGLYRIRILTATEEIILREFRIGEAY